MLFNSYEFIFLFLPVTLIVYFLLRSRNPGTSLYWLVLASLFFYGWWKPEYLVLLVVSVLVNYLIGNRLTARKGDDSKVTRKTLLILGVGANLALIGYYKYANFFIDNVNFALNSNIHLEAIILPLGISFFTFQQIAYLVDAYRGDAEEHNLRNYSLFVTFFPQLIAGPIVHHKEMMPQFNQPAARGFNYDNLVIGLTIFAIGLFKKVIIADGFAPYANTVFDMAEAGQTVYMLEAWVGTTAYALQMYFDFSGYSDMAIGLARMFGIVLPLNFNSPYKSNNIIDFWRNWHMTLTRFLTTYVYMPTGMPLTRMAMMKRFSPWKEFFYAISIPVMVTFLLSGLWHGAGWTFIVWGAMHGLYIVINHAWNKWQKMRGVKKRTNWWSVLWSRTLTFIAVLLAFVFFRAESMDAGIEVFNGMLGLNGFALPKEWVYSQPAIANMLGQFGFFRFEYVPQVGPIFPPLEDLINLLKSDLVPGIQLPAYQAAFMLIPGLLIAFFFPNTQQIMINFKPALEHSKVKIVSFGIALVQWKMNAVWAVIMGLAAAYATFGGSGVSQFLYFNF